jgi:hypothetical protein
VTFAIVTGPSTRQRPSSHLIIVVHGGSAPACFVRGSPRTVEQCLPRSGRCDPEAG